MQVARVKVVQEVREQHDVVRPAVFDLERAAGSCLVAVGDPRLVGVRRRDLEHAGPVDSHDAGAGILLRDLDTEQPVTRGDVQDGDGTLHAFEHDGAERRRHRGHHRRHAVRELHPGGILGLHGALAGKHRAAGPHDLGQTIERLLNHRIAQKARGRGDAGRGARVQEHRARLGVGIAASRLAEEPDHREEVAQDARPALGGRCVPCDRGHVLGSFADRPEQVELDRCAECRRALVGEQRFEYQRRRGRARRFRPGRHDTPPALGVRW